MIPKEFVKCDDIFTKGEYNNGIECINEEFYQKVEYSDDKLQYLDDVLEDASKDMIDNVCIEVDNWFSENPREGELIDEFLRKHCFKTLYHGTSIENAIESDGTLIPQLGAFTKKCYGISDDPEDDDEYCSALRENLGEHVYAADEFRIKVPLRFSYGEYKEHGALLEVDSNEFKRVNPYFDSGETDDYTSDEYIGINRVLVGNDLKRVYDGEITVDQAHWIDYDEFVKMYKK